MKALGRPQLSWLPPLLVLVAATIVVFHRLQFSLWYDETFSYNLVRQPWHIFLKRYVWGTEANMVLYYLILRGWLALTRLFGVLPTEVVVRLPSAVFAVGSAVIVYLLGRRLFGVVAGLVAAGLFLSNFLQVLLAQMARAYSLQLLLLAISWYCLVAALQQPAVQRRWLVGLTAANALAVYADLFSALVIAAQVIALLILPGPWRGPIRASLKWLIASYAAVGLLVLPLVVDAALHGGPNTWIPPAHLADIRAFFLFISGDNRIYERLLFGTAAFGCLMALLALARPGWTARLSRLLPDSFGLACALGCWFLIPIALSFALTRPGLNLHLFFHRYLIVVVPPLCLLAGLGVAALRWRAAQLLLAVALALAAWPQLPLYYRSAQVQDFRDPVQWVQQRYRAGDGLICDPVVECGVPVNYYLDAIPGPAHFDSDSPGRFFFATTTWVPIDEPGVLAYAKAHHRVFFIFAPLGNGAAEASAASRLESALSAQFTMVDQMTAHAAAADSSVRLFDTGQ